MVTCCLLAARSETTGVANRLRRLRRVLVRCFLNVQSLYAAESLAFARLKAVAQGADGLAHCHR